MTAIPPSSDAGGQQWPAPSPGGYQAPAAPPRGPRPRVVEISFWLWVVYLALTAIGVLVAFTQLDGVQAEVVNRLAEDPSLDRALIERVVTGVFVGVLVTILVFVVAAFILALLMRGGRNWARIVLAVLGGLAVLLGLFGLAGNAGPVLGAGLLPLLLLIGAIATMFSSAANTWFRPRRPQL
jgi:hypothetical protein